jgi:hypothetical protein
MGMGILLIPADGQSPPAKYKLMTGAFFGQPVFGVF